MNSSWQELHEAPLSGVRLRVGGQPEGVFAAAVRLHWLLCDHTDEPTGLVPVRVAGNEFEISIIHGPTIV